MRLRHLSTGFFVAAIIASPCLAQMGGQDGGPSSYAFVFQVSGIVRDSDSNRPIANIRVSLLMMGTPQASTLTSTDGQFSFTSIHNGRYTVEVAADNYQTYDQDVIVDRGSVTIDVALKQSIGTVGPPPGSSVSVHQLGVPAKAQNEFQKALDLMSAKSDYHGAIGHFDRAIQDYPDYYEAYAMEGSAYLALGDSASAERVLRKSIDLSANKYAPPLYLLAGMLNSANRFAEAEAPARQCIVLDETAWGGYFELARALLGLGRLDEALANAAKSRDMKPDNPKVYLLLANIHTAQYDYLALLQDLDKYLALNPTGPTADQARKERDHVQEALRNAPPDSATAPAHLQ
jgi:tetratricopeptide (TPR) repeat protein